MSNRISIDTRTIKPGDLFIPIKGPNFDGHDFIEEAKRKGAKVLDVKDGLKALQDLARKHRNKFKIPIIGITGSCGKTTTKEMLASILSQKYPVLKNEENLNNEIGVPLTLLKLRKKHRVAVIEMAIQKPGDMEELVEIVRPTHAIVTNVGEAHLEHMKSVKNTGREKQKIFRYAVHKPLSPARLKIDLPIPGKHNIKNAMAAAAMAKKLGCTKKQIMEGLKKFRPASKRMEIIKKNGITILNDCYNANPQSMRAALETLAEFKGRKTAVLGDMLELGSGAKKKHKEILAFAKKIGIDRVFTYGDNWPKKSPVKNIRPGDIILVKGSRGMKMENIVAGMAELADAHD